jgi:uncharacterized protein (TIGR00730 family)
MSVDESHGTGTLLEDRNSIRAHPVTAPSPRSGEFVRLVATAGAIRFTLEMNRIMEKAYKNLEFLAGREARTIRILSEYLEPQARFGRYRIKDTVVFYGSARALSPDEAAAALKDVRKTGDVPGIRRAEQDVKLARYYDEARTLARSMTEWSKGLHDTNRRFIVCSGGGPGIMEAANRGASEAAGISIGLGISLPREVAGNRFITRELGFEFHYFFMRKFWFVYLAKALVVFPGGFGTMDELFELLTLVQTGKTAKQLPIVLYGREFWEEIVNFDGLVRWGTIDETDLGLFRICDSPGEAFEYLSRTLTDLYLENDGEET